MKGEVVAIGTELLLGQIVDTNSVYIAEQLAMAGIDSHYQSTVGDNHGRIVDALRQALSRSDAVICCGGLGPTQDDITRAAIAEIMRVKLVRDEEIVEKIRSMFGGWGRDMPESNLRQADVPEGASINPAMPGTAPGLICPLTGEHEGKVIYAVPGVPWEMKQMMQLGVLPDLQQRAGFTGVIRSRILRTWGRSESGLAGDLDDEIRRLDDTGEATIAFLASGWEGLKLRITAKADTEETVDAALAAEEAIIREIVGDIVFGVDDDTMESVLLQLLRDRGETLAVAESLTGGMIGSRLTAIAGSSDVFVGGVIPYHRKLKVSLLGTPDVSAVSEEMAVAMAKGICRVLGTDVGLAVTGVAGPASHEGHEPGDVWIAISVNGRAEARFLQMPFDRERIRQFTCIQTLDLLRRRLLEPKAPPSAGDELVEEIDPSGAVKRVVTRAEMRQQNRWHRNVAVIVQRPSGAVVVHQRADWKDVHPSKWDLAFGGVPNVGEPAQRAAQRELLEEAGLVIEERELIELGTLVQETAETRWVGTFYLMRTDAVLYPVDGEVAEMTEIDIGDLISWAAGADLCPDVEPLVLQVVDWLA